MQNLQTTVLIVGAGPTGLATALSLTKNGFHDFIIVEAATSRAQASRAMTIHAATLEVSITVTHKKSGYNVESVNRHLPRSTAQNR
jgi:cation diffusion facilitator CzcD-associated flavoprotein CzcO